MSSYEIWAEGHRATGTEGGAVLLGVMHSSAKTFEAACGLFAAANPMFAQHFNPQKMTYWGCRLFDNEADARRSFG